MARRIGIAISFASGTSGPTYHGAVVRIITCNLYNGRASTDAVHRLIVEAEPDVVAAQELAPNAAEVLASLLPHGKLCPAEDYTGVGVALARPGNVDSFPMAVRDGLRTTLHPADWKIAAPLEVVNVHLTNPIDPPWRDSREARRRQVDAIVDHVRRGDDPLVVVGDFNSTPIWPAYRRVRSVTRDGVTEAGTRRRTWAPWWWFPAVLRIDHAMVRGGVRVATSSTRLVRGTDHRALIVDVELPSPS